MNDKREGARPTPHGFTLNPSRGKYTQHNGPTYRATAEGDSRMGFWVLERHCNGMGFLHGGMIASFFDSSMAWAIFDAIGRTGVTLKLTTEYLDTVSEGAWMESHPKVCAINDDIVHAQADLIADDGRLTAHASAVFFVRPKA